MSNKLRYTYSILSYRHDPWSGEALNVGVAVYSPDTRFFLIKNRIADGRLLCAYPQIERTALTTALNQIEKAASRFSEKLMLELDSEKVTADILCNKIMKNSDSSLRWGNQGSGKTDDLESVIENIFERFVLKFEKTRSKAKKTDEDIWRPLAAGLKSEGVYEYFEEKSISSNIDKVNFKHSWKNGCWHVVQPVSLDLESEDSIFGKAARWTGHLHNLQGANEKFKTYFIVGKPENDVMSSAYKRALKGLKNSPGQPSIFEEDQAEELVKIMVDQINDSIRPSKIHH